MGTIEEEIPSQDEPSTHIDTHIHVETIEILVPDGDIHIEEPAVDIPSLNVEVHSKPIGTFDIDITDQIDDLILTYESESIDKGDKTPDVFGDVPSAVIELPEMDGTDFPKVIVDEDNIDVAVEDVLEQEIDITTYDTFQDIADTSYVKSKLDVGVIVPPLEDEMKDIPVQPIELLKPVENDGPFLEPIENDFDETYTIGESLLAPVENEELSYSLLPMPMENDFPQLEKIEYDTDTTITIIGGTTTVFESDDTKLAVTDTDTIEIEESTVFHDEPVSLDLEYSAIADTVGQPNTVIHLETVDIPVLDGDIDIQGPVIDVSDKDIKISVVDGVTIEEEIPSQDEPSVHIDTDIHVETVEITVPDGHIHIEGPGIHVPDHKSDSSSSSSSESDDEGVLPTEDDEKKKKVKKMKVKKEKKPKDKLVVDGVTIEEEIPSQEEPSD